MALVINSNIQSLNSQRQLVKSGMEMDQAMERLSSGKKINTAADDAAGLAISNRMTSQINGLNRAVANANDGVSLIQTAEGALDESTNILQRMRELAIQSANGIYGDNDRATLDAEVQQLVAELDRISETTSFNGQLLLDGTLGEVDLQVGSEANQTISFSIEAMDADSLGLNSSTSFDVSGARLDTSSAASIAFDDGDIEINGQALQAFSNTANGNNLQDLIDDINDNVNGVSAELINTVEAASVGTGQLLAGDTLTLTLHGIDGDSDQVFTISNKTTDNMQELADLINDTTGNSIAASVSDEGKLVLASENGQPITTSDTGTSTGITDDFYNSFIALSSDDGSEIAITKGAAGTDADLAGLGFRETTGSGEVTGTELVATAQATNIAVGDVKINGVDIGAVTSASLVGKVDAINAKTDETGVTASITAGNAYTTDFAATSSELVTTGSVGISSSGAAETVSFDINGVAVSLSVASAGGSTTQTDIATAINAVSSASGVTAYVDENDLLHLFSDENVTISTLASTTVGDVAEAAVRGVVNGFDSYDGSQAFTVTGTGTASTHFAVAASAVTASGSIEINGTNITLTSLASINDVVTSINGSQATTGVTASVDENGELALSSNSVITVKAGDTNALTSMVATGIGITDSNGDGSLDDESVTLNAKLELTSEDNQQIQLDLTATGEIATGLLDMNTDLTGAVSGSPLSQISIGTQAGAQSAIDTIDNALETINATRSELGAANNRLDFTVSNLMNISENTAAARSRIMDADFAEETANLSRAQVLQQASQAMLAQANAAPQQVLSLLR
ncbi:flagellin [Pseudomaricurvus alkylphenolicus]|uniref:flagellin N-terminal helical domain-containing protein n=1 Tax=Pseudomaricurvus alkylphenolicus TaxID=1306991 RepID=UPI00141F1C37|nr:flagellin [Pseudomaricurvus alkylphenolicus]NIB43247.1 flagellin [Pseudomaricurvus alkylphenolicus]